MAYIPSECTRVQYDNAVYGTGPKHKLYIKVGDTELDEPDDFCEKLEWKNLLLSNGSKTFSLDNFVSKEIELVMRDYQIEDVNSELDIKLGTYVEEVSDYVYVPLGKYLIQDSPVTDKGKTTYKLRDRSVLFDFNYNAKPLIDESTHETTDGSKYVTKLEILQDICLQAGVDYVGSTSFIGYNDEIGIYDNSVSARIYVSHIAEQAGCIPYIDRNGNLNFLLINNSLPTHQIPFNLLESYTFKNKYKLSKTIYESGELYWENGTDDNDILFINSANPYISKQAEIDRIHNSVVGFEIDGISTGRVVGNPAIDSFDIIEIYDDENDKTFRTLGQNTLIYNGIMRQKFETVIEQEAKKINTTINSEASFKKYVKSEIDNVNATLSTAVQNVTTRIEEVETDIENIEFPRTFYRYSSNEDGTNMTESPQADTSYLGTYVGVVASENTEDYEWVLIKGAEGQEGKTLFLAYCDNIEDYSGFSIDGSDSDKDYYGMYVGHEQSLNPEDYEWYPSNYQIERDLTDAKADIINIDNKVEDVENTVETISNTVEVFEQTFWQQTSDAFQMLFGETETALSIEEIKEAVANNKAEIIGFKEFIKFVEGSIQLGAFDSNVKLILKNDRISFMTGGNETAWITGNKLHIADSTILNKLQIGQFVEGIDAYGNLNTKWVDPVL